MLRVKYHRRLWSTGMTWIAALTNAFQKITKNSVSILHQSVEVRFEPDWQTDLGTRGLFCSNLSGNAYAITVGFNFYESALIRINWPTAVKMIVYTQFVLTYFYHICTGIEHLAIAKTVYSKTCKKIQIKYI